ncbi:hypothetical protein HYH03_000123 [Edaphochlamys debaryana]|uniref:Radical SAM core domain-containing protein n=1 Tax=Edaphochlamys debaryana TaxID=47281 RepID=A0A835YF92_9CHLO|nr:hypothetical protein HYH03_000123 [Edaphochlamys debaryana]|eukprot:KAG2501618.1 hypothetical protein HYH03_000123 [Edaphochlamys debaryana]
MPPEHATAAVKAAKARARAWMTPAEGAQKLGEFLGLGPNGLEPATTVELSEEQILGILEAVWRRGDAELEKALYAHANAVTNKYCGGGVYYRGLIEFSNVCQNDCGYCGIRNNQKDVWRYTMPEEEVVEVAKWALENGIRNIMLQGGELRTEQRLQYLERVTAAIRRETVAMDLAKRAESGAGAPPVLPGGEEELGVAVSLSVGELPIEDYERLFRAGARRYLIRIETSNPDLYHALHPAPMSWHHRVECLQNLKKVGFMLGTGIMVGLPGQTLRDLARDVLFFKEVKADMIGMGPFITQPGTPVTATWNELYPAVDKNAHMRSMFSLTCTMNALVRLTMGNPNISATTALQAIVPTGRELALERGANVVMPILTPTKYRESYQLYEGKPCITDTAVQCRRCLDMRLHSVGKTSAAGVWGDPASFLRSIEGLHVQGLGDSPALEAAASADFHDMGGTPLSPLPLHRLVYVPEDHEPPPKPHGRDKKAVGGAAHDSHDDPVPAGAASTAAHAGAGRAGAAPGALASRAPRLRGPSAASPLRPGAVSARAAARRAVACAAAATGPAPGAAAGAAPGLSSITANGVPRINVGVFGAMNAGKSTLVNALSQQEACIVDSTPGTTADVKPVLLELHDLGPAKLLDTAGLDEQGELGEKKRRKALNSLKECDVAVVVVPSDVLRAARSHPGSLSSALLWERRVLEQAAKYGVSPVLLLNVKGSAEPAEVEALLQEARQALDPSGKVPSMALDLVRTPLHERSTKCAEFVKVGARLSARYGKLLPGCLPRWCLGKGSMVLMVIPMDAETPGGRLLRPQAQVQEEAIRAWATVLSVRLDLDAARGRLGPEAREAERQRFAGVIRMLQDNQGPSLVVTDSQAVDVVAPWTSDPSSGAPLVPFTTFSIAMAYQQSGGNLGLFVEGLAALNGLREGDRVLISEACNHNRITEACNDIGMVQIPQKLEKMMGGQKLAIEHSFGREFPELETGKLGAFKLVIHCGGCMIDSQKMQQRMFDLGEAHVPVVNYGVFFSWAASPEALRRALEPWGVEPPPRLMAGGAGPAPTAQQPAGAGAR